MLPRINAADDRIGFHWSSPDGRAMKLAEICALPDVEPGRLLPTHLEALDDVLIDVAARCGQVLGGGRGPRTDEHGDLTIAYREIDRLCHEYADAHHRIRSRGGDVQSGVDVRAGQIIATAALFSIRIRQSIGLMGPAPFDGQLDVPRPGVVGGQAGLHWVDDRAPWKGARWLVVSADARRLPATLSMLLFDSSGVNKDACLSEHRAALERVSAAVGSPDVEPMIASAAVDWLLFDWAMAHRQSPDSGAVEVKPGQTREAGMLVLATAASAQARSRFDLGLLDLPAS